MKFSGTAIVGTLAALASCIQAAPLEKRVSGVPGFDISGYQPNPNYSSDVANGAKFVVIKATEGTSYKNPYFSSQYNGATNAGLIRGAYHFARPDKSSGAAQAKYFLANGGGWSNDGITLPGSLDMESSSGVATCYGLSQSGMVSWIKDFSNTYYSSTGRYPTIYCSSGWWNQCVASSAFSSTNALWIANYGVSSPKIPTGWDYYTFWQYADSGTYDGDQDTFNGSLDNLKKFARGG
ncbi:probable lysozyme [Sporisorium reilianum f. sp. reilianum]|uniref:Lysozyme n=1 Tax=Sporisorium reilianum f. sp. reilianum TaxID=72559 RepID=A0A2N8UDX5_9BASI|nr:probable lysozyme [Sporisorium reilianum f. sp. reilianum]